MRLNIFAKQKTPPTVAQVQAEQVTLAERREAIRQRLGELEIALVAAYGDASANVDSIHTEAARLERELASLATVSAELEAERTAAAKRQIIADHRAELDTLKGHVDTVRALNPRILELQRQLADAVQESNQHRQAIRNLRNGSAPRMTRRCQEYGVDTAILATIDADLRLLDKEYTDALQGNIAETAGEAVAIADAMPSMADASLKVKG